MRLWCHVTATAVLGVSLLAIAAPPFQAEFALPVYLNRDLAALVVEHSGHTRLTVSFSERTTGLAPRGPMQVDVPPGARTLTVPVQISDWPDGEYLTTIRTRGEDDSALVRVLRKQTIPAPEPPAEPIDVRGIRMLLWDDWHVAESQGLRTQVHPAETFPVTTGMLSEGYCNQSPRELAIEPDGTVVVAFYTMDRRKRKSVAYVARSRDLRQWQIVERRNAQPVASKALRSRVKVPWRWYDPQGKKAKYRRYDSRADGPVDLKAVHVQYSGWSTKPARWGTVEIPGRSTFPIWREFEQDFVILKRHPLTRDKWRMADGDHGEWHDSNDNWGGQWLSADGKTRFFSQARVIPRHPPFRIPYDNILGSRTLVMWATRDGFHWQPTYGPVPSDSDPPGLQFYGSHGFWAEARRLRLAYLWTYDQARQQIALGLAYSRDGLHWQRMEGRPLFVPNGGIGSWNFGLVAPALADPLESDGRVYHLLRGLSAPHFFLWTAHGVHNITASALEQRLGGSRRIEDWPYWPQFGSWEALAAHLRRGSFTVGLMRYRRDGWVSLSAGPVAGHFTTKVLLAGERLAINARTRAQGFVRVEVLDAVGEELPGYCGAHAARFRGDSVSQRLTWREGQTRVLPKGLLRLRVTLREADLFALEW